MCVPNLDKGVAACTKVFFILVEEGLRETCHCVPVPETVFSNKKIDFLFTFDC